MTEPKTFELTLLVSKKTFKDQNGEFREYASLTTEIDGEVFTLKVLENQKKLFNYMLKMLGFYD